MKTTLSFFLLLFSGLGTAVFGQSPQSQIKDADGNTLVQTEANPNEDRVRFKLGGVEVLVMRRTAAGSVLFENTNNTSNTFLGIKAGESNTTGALNLFMGESAGSNNSSGSSNTFLGQAAGLQSTTANGNTFIGASAGQLNVTGDGHVFIGSHAGAATVNNSSNTYVGFETGLASTAGSNTYIGALAGRNNTTGGSNVFVGTMAGQNTSTGSDNTLLGTQVGLGISTGNGNVVVGKGAGSINCTNSTLLGNGTKVSLAGMNNATALGSGAVVNSSNKIRFGSTAVSVIEGNVAYTVSDGRFKTEVRSDAPGLNFILGLQPVTYRFGYTAFSKFLGEENVDYATLAQKDQRREMGLIAQDVERLCTEQGVVVDNLVHVPDSPVDNYSIAYGQLVVPLVRAVQEQQAQIEAQQTEIAELKSLVGQLLMVQNQAAAPATELQIWPNPAGDALTLTLPAVTSEATLSLWAADGKLLRSQPAQEGAQSIDLHGLPAAMYFVQMNSPGQAPAIKAFLKSE